MTDLGYFAADALQMTLYQIKGQLISHEVHPMTLGPWQMELPIEVESDVMTPTELGFWLTLGKALHGYLVVREKECWFFVLNAYALETCELASHTAKGRIEDIKPAIRGVFRWKHDEWLHMQYHGTPTVGNTKHAHNLVEDRTKQGAEHAVSSPADGARLVRRSRQ